MLRAFGEYNPEAMIVFDVDFGHTDPQWVLPYGGRMTVDGPAGTSWRTLTMSARSRSWSHRWARRRPAGTGS